MTDQITSQQAQRLVLLEREKERLEGEIEAYENQWNRKHWLMLFGLLALPAYMFLGKAFAVLMVLCTPCLVITYAYLVGVRKAEAKALHAEILREMGSVLK